MTEPGVLLQISLGGVSADTSDSKGMRLLQKGVLPLNSGGFVSGPGKIKVPICR